MISTLRAWWLHAMHVFHRRTRRPFALRVQVVFHVVPRHLGHTIPGGYSWSESSGILLSPVLLAELVAEFDRLAGPGLRRRHPRRGPAVEGQALDRGGHGA